MSEWVCDDGSRGRSPQQRGAGRPREALRSVLRGAFCKPDTDRRFVPGADTLIGGIPIFTFSARGQSRRTMRKTFYAILGLAASLLAPFTGRAAVTAEYSVQVSANVKASPAQITLSWPQDSISTPKSYVVYRRAPGVSSWGTGTTLPGSTTTYVDKNVDTGVPYEYQIVKQASGYTGYGYIYSGINVPLTENRGKLAARGGQHLCDAARQRADAPAAGSRRRWLDGFAARCEPRPIRPRT